MVLQVCGTLVMLVALQLRSKVPAASLLAAARPSLASCCCSSCEAACCRVQRQSWAASWSFVGAPALAARKVTDK